MAMRRCYCSFAQLRATVPIPTTTWHTTSRQFSSTRTSSRSRHSSPFWATHPASQSRSTPTRVVQARAPLTRPYSSDSATAHLQPPDYLNEAERAIFEKIKGELQPIRLEVQDISGGCGSMYGLDIVSPKFAGLSVIKQHQMVNRILKEELKTWHGVQLKTMAA